MNPYRSIRWLLIMWNMLLLAVVLATLLSLHYHLQRKSTIAQIDTTLQNALMIILPFVAPPNGPPPDLRFPPAGPPPKSALPSEDAQEFLKNLDPENLYISIWNQNGTCIDRYGHVPNVDKGAYFDEPVDQHFIMHKDYRELITHSPSGTLIVVGRPMADINLQLKHVRGYLILIGCGIFLLGYFGGRYMIIKALQPIREISKTAEEIAGGDHSQRIELASAPEELAGLALTLNNSFNHLDIALENQKRFSADASHELRTPIAVVLAQTQAALKRDRSNDEYKAVLEACQRAAQRMRNMADGLLDLTRIDGNETAPVKKIQPLNGIISLATKDASGLSELHPIDFQGLDELLSVEIDQERIHQILMNLIRNAIQHNPAGCAIHVLLKRSEQTALITVADEGSGIPQESLPHIFERFYRADKSRSREQGGVGLGLSIVKSLVDAHGGTIQATSTCEKGTTFTIKLPLKS